VAPAQPLPQAVIRVRLSRAPLNSCSRFVVAQGVPVAEFELDAGESELRRTAMAAGAGRHDNRPLEAIQQWLCSGSCASSWKRSFSPTTVASSRALACPGAASGLLQLNRQPEVGPQSPEQAFGQGGPSPTAGASLHPLAIGSRFSPGLCIVLLIPMVAGMEQEVRVFRHRAPER